MQLVTGCNAGYLPRMLPYLESLNEYSDFTVNFIGVGFEPPVLYDKIKGVYLDSQQNAGAPPKRSVYSTDHFCMWLTVHRMKC